MSKLSKKLSKQENLRLKSSNALLEKRVATLEADKQAAIAKADGAEIDSALDRALGAFSFESPDSLELARASYRLQIKRDDESGELRIGDRKVDEHLKVDLPARCSFLLAKTKDGNRIAKGPSTAELMDRVGPGSSAEEKSEASRRIAALLN